jgi:CRISPR/Cas system-associated endonuclease/helicase Cas3
VAKILGIPTDPWNRIFPGLNPKHPIVWLDGSVPPLLREHYLSFVKSRLNCGLPTTLLTTQIVEVGVDLDFDAGYTDLISLASILQRGGRVARESRSDGRRRYVHLFNFKTLVNERGAEVEKTTKEILDTVALGSVMLTEQAAAKIRLLLTNTQYTATEYFSCWQYQEIKKEFELIEANTRIAIQELQAIEDPTISDIVTLDLQHAHVGLTLQHLETITQLYGDEPHGESVVLFESSEEVEVVQGLFGANQEKLGYQELAKRRVIIHPNLVASLLSENFLEREVHWWTDRTVVKADNIV